MSKFYDSIKSEISFHIFVVCLVYLRLVRELMATAVFVSQYFLSTPVCIY